MSEEMVDKFATEDQEKLSFLEAMVREDEENTEARTRKINYDFSLLKLEEFILVDPIRGPVRVLVSEENARGFQNMFWAQQVQYSHYIEVIDGAVLKDKRKELYHERRLHRRGTTNGTK